MVIQCPKCKFHAEHIYTIEISPTTQQRWRIERCPNCFYAGWPDNPELERIWLSRRNQMDKPNDRRPFWDLEC